MSDSNISPNKVNDKQERRAEHITDRLQDQGMGREEADHRALEQAVAEQQGGRSGGGSSGGDPKKDSSHVGQHRNGSRGQQ